MDVLYFKTRKYVYPYMIHSSIVFQVIYNLFKTQSLLPYIFNVVYQNYREFPLCTVLNKII